MLILFALYLYQCNFSTQSGLICGVVHILSGGLTAEVVASQTVMMLLLVVFALYLYLCLFLCPPCLCVHAVLLNRALWTDCGGGRQ